MASTLNEESVERKLHAVNNTQDGIQSMSLWIIHHKAHHKKIVDLWLKVLKKGKTAHRLTLFYLCNDVVQNCKKKQAKIYMDTFKGVLKDAAPFVRDSAIKSNVGRIFTIWEERNVYDSNFISELKDMLEPDTSNRHSTRASQMAASPKHKPKTSKPTSQQPSSQQHTQQTSQVDEKTKLNHQQIVAEFKAQKMLEKISSVSKLEAEGELKLMQLSTLRLDASNLEAVKQLKDRAHGKEFSRQFEDACNKLEDYVVSLQKEIDHRTAMITMLEQSELFYEDQYREAKIVANAYKNFGSRVAIVKKKLDELKLTLPDPPSPMPSPTPDAPSPGSTPPADIEMQADNTEAVDMELSESDNDTDATRNILEVVNDTEANAEMSPQSITWPPSPSSDSNQMVDHKGLTEDNYDSGAGGSSSKKTEECNSLEKRIASMLPNLPLGASMSSPINEVPPPVLQQSSSRKEHRYHSDRKHSRSSTTASDESPDWLDGSNIRSSSTSPAHSSHKSSHRKLHSSSSGMHNSSSSSSSSSSRVASSTATAAAAAATAYDSPPLSNDEGSSTPLNDEGGGTPVQDEKEEQTTRENPIDFLTKLINQTQKSPKTSTASFLQNLMNTGMKPFTSYDDTKTKETPVDLNPPTMPPQMPPPTLGPVPVSMPSQSALQPPSPQHNQTATPPQSWAAWKAQHGPPDDLPNMITSAPPPPPPNMPPQMLSPQQHEPVGMPSMPQRPDITTLPPMMGPPPPPDHLPGMAPMPPLPEPLPSGVAPVPPPDCLPPGMVNPGNESIPPPGLPPMQPPPESVGMANIQRHDQMVMPGGIPGINPPFHPADTPLPPRSPWKHDMNAPYCPISNASDPSDGYNSSPQGQTSPEPCPMPPPWMSQPPPQPHDPSIPPPLTMGPPPPHARPMGRSVLQDFSNPSDTINPLPDSLQGAKPPPQAPPPSNGNTPAVYTSRVNRVLSQSEFLDDQREFTEKLKRKTTSNLVTPPIVDSLPDLTETVGTAVRNLTAVKLEEDANVESNPAANTDETESNQLADSGTAEDTETANKEEEPKGAPILTVSGIASRRYEPDRLRTISDHRGDSGRRNDSMGRRFEQPVTDHTTHRQTSDSYRDRRRTDREFYRNTPYQRDAYSYPYNQDWQRYYAQTNPYMGPPAKRPYEPYNIYYPSKY
ncbi:Regulation of nuclear pre-mRNA domain-containing protein 2 [Acanthosepion pharaonis]|uniref:Regulation of nuclear pre-mRNA domain-containing protein 2 n=1 Tax=Acanthosepion pharaonis TaxID=158019 RepID=A0A812ES42_ACAPH|nr:Regulation of nuclear pre-mRNA domain-containing protein 2 [Sepia pharaonis]